MRLLFVSHSFPPRDKPLANVGGMQRVATELYAALETNQDLRLDALVLRASWRWTHVRVVPFFVQVIWRLHRISLRRDVDVVLFSSMVTAAIAILFRRRFNRAGIRMAAIVHGRDVTLPVGVYQRLVGSIFRSLDMVLPISKAVQAECLARGATRGQIRRVPNGINLTRYQHQPARSDARSALRNLIAERSGAELQDESIVLCSVGRQIPRKGFRWFTENVLPELPSHVIYVLAGEGPESEPILKAAKKAGVEDRVVLLGRVTESDLAALYRGSDLFIMPNVPVAGDIEGFGVVLLEAGANGLPSIASNLEGIADVISPGINGLLVRPHEAADFAEAILSYVKDPSRLDIAAARAESHVRSTFGWEAVARHYVRALSQLLPSHPPVHSEPEVPTDLPVVVEPATA